MIFQWLIHGASLEPMYPSASCTDSERDRMLKSMYMARMAFVTFRTGPGVRLNPISVVEMLDCDGVPNLRSTDATDAVYDSDFEGQAEASLDGFGFKFSRTSLDNLVHHARVAIIDFSSWTLTHYLHFLGKLDYFIIWKKKTV